MPLRLLATLLAQPEEDALAALKDMLPLAPWLAPAIAELEGLPLARWQGEHTRLFVNGYPKTPCPPFEAAYREGQMGGGTTCERLTDLYRRAGLAATGGPPDYLGTQLECVAYLADQAATTDAALLGPGRESPDTLLCALWEDHLSQWLPRFAEDLQQAARLALYRALGAQLAELTGPHAGSTAHE